MKKIRFLPVLLMFWPYLILTVPLFISLFPTASTFIMWYMRIYSLVTIPLVCLGNLFLVCFGKSVTPAELAEWNLRLKLAHIPFYLMGFAFGFAAMIFAPAIALLEWGLMMTTSGYGIRASLQAGKQQLLSVMEAALLILGHCFFVTDVICAILLKKKLDNRVGDNSHESELQNL